MPTLETKRVLITVKAYPNPSKKYGETMCCAGIDMDTLQWIRLYPIPFRDLDESKQFKKYTVIETRCRKAQDDHRIESYKIDCDSIRLLSYFDTQKDKKWNARKKIVLPTVVSSFCKILTEVESGKSLGTFKPSDVTFQWKKAQHDDENSREACYAQLSFWNKTKKAIEQIPFDFYYGFKCFGELNCPGHRLPIIDWEIGQAYRDWRYKYKDRDILLEKIKERWLTRICAERNEVYFYVGNMQRFRDKFMVLGVFYPPKS
jgi:hypothetical protein